MATLINTPNAPAAIGPYSQAYTCGNLVFTAGQIGVVPTTGQMISTQFVDQAHQVFKNIDAILVAAGSAKHHVLKYNVYLTDLAHWESLNEVMKFYTKMRRPARSTVQVAALPKGALIEVDCIAEIVQKV